MKHQGTKFSRWLLCIIVFLILFPIFFFPYFSSAARRSPYTIDALDHDFPYLNCSMRVIDADVRDVLRAFANVAALFIRRAPHHELACRDAHELHRHAAAQV